VKYPCVRCDRVNPVSHGFLSGCRGALEVEHLFLKASLELFEQRLINIDVPCGSGVWRYKELKPGKSGYDKFIDTLRSKPRFQIREGKQSQVNVT